MYVSIDISLVAVIPSILLAILIYLQDRVEREPVGLLLSLFAAGVAAYIPAYFLQGGLSAGISRLFSETVYYDATGKLIVLSNLAYYLHRGLTYFVAIAAVDEVLVFTLLYLITRKNKNFNYLFDGVVYSVCISMGFATAENLFFAWNNGWDTLLLHSLSVIPSHLMLGIIRGCMYSFWHVHSIAKKRERLKQKNNEIKVDTPVKTKRWIVAAVILPMVAHGAYRFAGYFSIRELNWVFWIVSFSIYGMCAFNVLYMSRWDGKISSSAAFLLRDKYPEAYEVTNERRWRVVDIVLTAVVLLLFVVGCFTFEYFMGAFDDYLDQPEMEVLQEEHNTPSPSPSGTADDPADGNDSADDKPSDDSVDDKPSDDKPSDDSDNPSDDSADGAADDPAEEEDPEDAEQQTQDDDKATISSRGILYDSLTDKEKSIYDQCLQALNNGKESVALEDVDEAQIKTAVFALLDEHPEFFWLRNGYSGRYYSTTKAADITFKSLNYWTYSTDKDGYSDRLNDAIDQVVEAAMKYSTEYERVKFVHDYLVQNTDYSYSALNEMKTADDTLWAVETQYATNAYGCLVEGSAVCAGYAKAFKLILNQMGLECHYVTGVAGGDSHAWNCVKLDGEYYLFDTTWDDDGGEVGTDNYHETYYSYTYFGNTDEQLGRTHTSDADVWPECTALEYNYFYHEGLYFEEYDFEAVKEAVENVQPQHICLAFSTAEEMNAALKDLIYLGRLQSFSSFDGRYVYMSDDINFVLTVYGE